MTQKVQTHAHLKNCEFSEEVQHIIPFNKGILIFDKVKTGMKVHYHAKAGTFIGLSMSCDELGSLHDVYQPLRPDHRTQKATYILTMMTSCALCIAMETNYIIASVCQLKAHVCLAAYSASLVDVYKLETTEKVGGNTK